MDRGINYRPTKTELALVETLVAFGHSQRVIAKYMDIHTDTLSKHYKDELAKGKINLALTCGRLLRDCVDDNQATYKDRINAAQFLLSRLCGWSEKIHQDASIDTMSAAIRESVKAVSAALSKETQNDKDVESEQRGIAK